MDIHKPKPFHSWREFLSEILIVVLGVTIALGGEQLVETIHWNHKIHSVEDAMRTELMEDDLPQAYARLVIAHCLAGQLDKMQAMAKPGADGMRFAAEADDYRPPIRSWDNAAHQLALQSDLSSHMSAERLASWSSPYSNISNFAEDSKQEVQASQRLRRKRFADHPLSESDANLLSDVIDDLRAVNLDAVQISKFMLTSAQRLQLTLPATVQDQIVAQGRRAYGSCAVRPDWTALPDAEQIYTKEQERGFDAL